MNKTSVSKNENESIKYNTQNNEEKSIGIYYFCTNF